jgi:hypothetical protein
LAHRIIAGGERRHDVDFQNVDARNGFRTSRVVGRRGEPVAFSDEISAQ